MSDHFVALFRGINVGRGNRVAMADLRTLFEALGFVRVESILASGNLVFTVPPAGVKAPEPKDARMAVSIRQRIEAALRQQLGLDVLVTVLSAGEIDCVVAQNPLLGKADNHSKLLVSVLYDIDERSLLEPLQQQEWGAEELVLGARVAYQWCPLGVLESRLPAAIGKLLGSKVTTRNWATIIKIQALLARHSVA